MAVSWVSREVADSFGDGSSRTVVMVVFFVLMALFSGAYFSVERAARRAIHSV